MECFLLVTVLWVFSVCLHEFGHAIVAYHGGDHTVVEKGYLKMNPLHYAHPVYSLLMPVVFMMMGGIGLPGGAVYIETRLLRSRAWETAVALAGPAMNLILVLLISACFRIGLLPDDPQSALSVSIAFLLQLELSSIVLCLLPIPPMDGFRALAPWLPEPTRASLFAMSSQGMWIIFLALWFIQPLNHAFWNLVFWASEMLGVDPGMGFLGLRAFRFWDHGF
jgi:Zn-dependent protease